MSERKLYECRVEFTYYAEARSLQEAAALVREVLATDGPDEPCVTEVRHRDWPLADGWVPESVVYGPQGDIALGELLRRLPLSPRLPHVR